MSLGRNNVLDLIKHGGGPAWAHGPCVCHLCTTTKLYHTSSTLAYLHGEVPVPGHHHSVGAASPQVVGMKQVLKN